MIFNILFLLSCLCWPAQGLLCSEKPNTFGRKIHRNMAVQGIASAGLKAEEQSVLMENIGRVCQEIGFSTDDMVHMPAVEGKSPGATGRVLVMSSDNDEDNEDLQAAIAQIIDELLYDESSPVDQPILLSIQEENSPLLQKPHELEALIRTEIDQYSLAERIEGSSFTKREIDFTATDVVHVDGAMVTNPFNGVESWDTSSLLVFDNLVSKDLRRRLLDVVLGDESWDDIKKGPNPNRWVRGGLIDTPGDGSGKQEENGGYGLSDEAIKEICFEEHDAIQEFEAILASLFPQYVVSRMPEAVLGASVTPLTANAPIHGHQFDYHIDADPYFAPPSPWTDVFGRYPNRLQGKARFMTCLVYLNDEWNCDGWGAVTRCLDVATDTSYDVQPKPGRVLLMDQDITHTVVAPEPAAGKRPRYSLVWKLVLHPKTSNQDMTDLSGLHEGWPEPKLIGSANR